MEIFTSLYRIFMGLGTNLIEQERERQIHREGWSSEHDDKHVNNELALAAICYAEPNANYIIQEGQYIRIPNEDFWPEEWDKKWFKPTTRIRDLVKAGALIAAEIDRLQRIEIKKAKEEYIPKIKELVDKAFEEFGEENDNIIILSACYYPERYTVEIDDPLESIHFNKGYKSPCENKLYFPIGKNWDLGNWNRKGEDEDKLSSFYEKYVDPICNALDKCCINWSAEDYYKDDNDALNEYWCGCIGIMKDYKIVSFVIRDDGLLCSENSINDGYNKIIEQL